MAALAVGIRDIQLRISGKDLSTYTSSSLAYYAHITVDNDKSCYVP